MKYRNNLRHGRADRRTGGRTGEADGRTSERTGERALIFDKSGFAVSIWLPENTIIQHGEACI